MSKALKERRVLAEGLKGVWEREAAVKKAPGPVSGKGGEEGVRSGQ